MALKQFGDADCLALVDKSPAAVAAHDKTAWLALFARYNIVEDPVGSSPHITGIYDQRTGYRGRGGLSRFYDTFIAPNTIRFFVERDVVCGLHVVRDLTIEIVMSAKVTVRVPAHLLYELAVEGGELKISRLAAHWELAPMLRQQMASGMPFLAVGMAAFGRLWRHQGLSGTAGFMRALSGVGAAGKAQVESFAGCFHNGNLAALEGLFINPAIAIGFPHAQRELSIAACLAEGGTWRFTKLLAAGNVVSATVAYSRPDRQYDGVAIFELERRSLRIAALSFYWA